MSRRNDVPAYEPPMLPLDKNALKHLDTLIPRTHESLESKIGYALEVLTSSASTLGSLNANVDDKHTPLLDELEAAARSLVDSSARLQASKNIIQRLSVEESDRYDEANERIANGEEPQWEPVGVEEGVLGRYKRGCDAEADKYQGKSDKEK